ncbi:MAG: poly-beta-1,6-N-acetyl-D-glucosamine synthase [Gammaproteobacteria bacterium]|nr:poly-beta-1,6-N-acetyl-D-glucosamine synthase [Gammaproteobacteria bacterium]
METLYRLLQEFALIYPLFMAYLWIVGGIYYFFHWERRGKHSVDKPPPLTRYPGVSIIVPAHNESYALVETIESLLAQQYPEFEIIVVNDGSSDDTAGIMDGYAQRDAIRAIHLASNQGKAAAMRVGTLAARHEILVCIDGDAILDPHAVHWLARHFVHGHRVGAVTGNPRVRTRSTLLGKIQVGEFSSIIGLIKRAQRIYGRVFTVSGVVAAFRKSALVRAGFWDLNKLTDDIDISWRLQMDHWSVRFESNALCWILMPETLNGLWRQRLRWAQGGVEVALEHFGDLMHWRRRHMWPVLAEFCISVVWSYTMLFLGVSLLLGQLLDMPPLPDIGEWLPSWGGAFIGVTCLLQFAVSLAIDSRYEKGLARYYYWIIWYPVIYWLISVLTTLVALPRALFSRHNRRALWVSPDRGEQFHAPADR